MAIALVERNRSAQCRIICNSLDLSPILLTNSSFMQPFNRLHPTSLAVELEFEAIEIIINKSHFFLKVEEHDVFLGVKQLIKQIQYTFLNAKERIGRL